MECSPHVSLNHSRGMIFAPQLVTYSEEKLEKELADQGVIKVERIKKKVSGATIPLPNLILTFDSIRLPAKIKAAWYRYDVRQYIPRPRRCFHCQNYGHVTTSCRQNIQGKPAVCVNCGEIFHGDCSRDPHCIHCGDKHPSSSQKCDVYLFEKEVQAVRVTERISFLDAKQRVMNLHVRPGVLFSTVAANRRKIKCLENKAQEFL